LRVLFALNVSPYFMVRLKRSPRFALYTSVTRSRMSGDKAHSCFRQPVVMTVARSARHQQFETFCDFVLRVTEYQMYQHFPIVAHGPVLFSGTYLHSCECFSGTQWLRIAWSNGSNRLGASGLKTETDLASET